MVNDAGTIYFSLNPEARSLVAHTVNADGSSAGTFEYKFFTMFNKTPDEFVSIVLNTVKNKPEKLMEYFRYSSKVIPEDKEKDDTGKGEQKVWHIRLN